MGIKNLNKFLREKCPQIFKTIHLSNYMYKKIAIDISLYLYKFKAVHTTAWLGALLNLILSLRHNEIHCVFIFDGKAPPEKDIERAKRHKIKTKLIKQVEILEAAVTKYKSTGEIEASLLSLYHGTHPVRLLGKPQKIDMSWVMGRVKQKRKQIINVGKQDFDEAKELFRILKVPYYTAPWEAEKMCSKLCIDGMVDAVLSEDTDVMAYGTPVFLTKINYHNDTCVEINQVMLLKELKLTSKQFLDFCIMCGTDYNPNIFRIGAFTAYKKITKFGNIEIISAETKVDVSVLNHKRGRELFTKFSQYRLQQIPYCGTPNLDSLELFMIKHDISMNSETLYSAFNRDVIIEPDPRGEKSELK